MLREEGQFLVATARVRVATIQSISLAISEWLDAYLEAAFIQVLCRLGLHGDDGLLSLT